MQKRIREGAPSRVPCRSSWTHFFDAATKATSEHKCAGYLYTRGSENASEETAKKLERGPRGEPLPAAWALKIDGL